MAEDSHMQLFRRNRDGANETSAAVAQQASASAEQVGKMVEQGVDRANAALATARERGEQAAERTAEALEDWRGNLETTVRAQPMASLFIAGLVGMAFGAFLRMGSGDKSS
jgi:ElaB/YqjD/DUF883 family membrane-anchored ribosome-binding protein